LRAKAALAALAALADKAGQGRTRQDNPD